MKNISLSLADIAGEEYISSVCRASAFCGLGRFVELQTIAHEKVDFFPEEFQKKIDDLLPLCGQNVISPLANSSGGAATAAFAAAFKSSVSATGITKTKYSGPAASVTSVLNTASFSSPNTSAIKTPSVKSEEYSKLW